MDITRTVMTITRQTQKPCTNCESMMVEGDVVLHAHVTGDYYKVLYDVCSPACEYEINREDDV